MSLTSVVMYLDWFGGFNSDGFLISSRQSCQTFGMWKLTDGFFYDFPCFLIFPCFLHGEGGFHPRTIR